MYYIEADISFQNGIEMESFGFHYISRYTVDYINNRVEIEISSNKSKSDWLAKEYFSPFVNFYELDSAPDFNTDPTHFILKRLVTKPTTVFYGKTVQKDYEITTVQNIKDGDNK